MSTLIIAASSLMIGVGSGFLLAVWLIVDWERQARDEERKKRHQRLLEECSWYSVCDGIYRR